MDSLKSNTLPTTENARMMIYDLYDENKETNIDQDLTLSRPDLFLLNCQNQYNYTLFRG